MRVVRPGDFYRYFENDCKIAATGFEIYLGWGRPYIVAQGLDLISKQSLGG